MLDKVTINVVLWGAGQFGEEMLEYFRHVKKYNVIGIFDQNLEKCYRLVRNELVINSKEKLIELYKEGKYDFVMISVYGKEITETIRNELQRISIPALLPEEIMTYTSVHVEQSKKCRYDEYELVTCDNVVLKGRNSQFCIYKEQKVIKEGWLSFYWTQKMSNMACPIWEEYVCDETVEEAYVVARDAVKNSYWHFLYDCLSTVFAMEETGYKGKYLVFDSELTRTFFRLLGINASRIIWLSEEAGTSYLLKKYYWIEINAEYKGKVVRRMAESIMQRVEMEKEYPKRIFIKRIGVRKMLGAEALLEKYNFTTIIPEELSIEEQIAYTHNAEIVIAPHGANCANAFFMKSGATLLECFGKNYNPVLIPNVLCWADVKYRMLVEERCEYEDGNTLEDYTIQPLLLESTMREILERYE